MLTTGTLRRVQVALRERGKPQKLGRVNIGNQAPLDLNAQTAKVEQDIAIAKSWSQGTVTSAGEETHAERGFQP